MEKIIQFEKDLIFKTNISEITSISLEREILIDDLLVKGKFIINGDYKITDSSQTVESFKYELPLSINIEEQYDTSKASVDIDDFYYEVINTNVLHVNIDIKIDNIKERKKTEMDSNMERLDVAVEDNKEEVIEKINDYDEKEVNKPGSLFEHINEEEKYVSYNLYIMRDDNLNSVLEKYQVSEEELKKYNDLSNIQEGTKIVIPSK